MLRSLTNRLELASRGVKLRVIDRKREVKLRSGLQPVPGCDVGVSFVLLSEPPMIWAARF